MNTTTLESATEGNHWEDISLSPLDIEAKNRLAQILTSLESRFGGERLARLARYELQEISAGKTIPEDKAIFQMDYLQKLLYTSEMDKKESRRILADIAHRARKLLEKSEARIQKVVTKI